VALISLLSLAAVGVIAFALGRALFEAATGALFAAILLTRPVIVNDMLHSAVDLPFLALVLGAGVAGVRGRSPWLVLGLLGAAGLLRPEGWGLALGYGAWLLAFRRDLPRAGVIAAAAAAPLVWAGFDVLVAGDPLFSLHATRDLAAELDRPRSADTALRAIPDYLQVILGSGIAWAGAIGCVVVAWREPGRAALPLVVLALGLAGFLVLGVAGLPILYRYLLLPSTALALFAAALVFAWRREPARGPQRALGLAGALAAVVLAWGALDDRRDLARIAEAAAFRADVQRDLREVLRRAPVVQALDRCPLVHVAGYRPVPAIAYELDRSPRRVRVAEDVPGAGVAVNPTPGRAAGAFALTPGDPATLTADQLAAFRLVANNASWSVHVRCP
jgi:hypothetical protein